MKEGKGKIKNSKVFKFIKDRFPDIAGKGLEVFGDLTGRESIESVGKWIQGEKELTAEDLAKLENAKELDLKELDIIESNLTERHKNDMASDSWLSKNVRPIVVLNFTALIDFMIIMATYDRPIEERYIGLIMTLGVTVLGGYFTIRTIEKRNNKKYI